MPLMDFQRMNVRLPFMPIDIEKKLRRLCNRQCCVVRMIIPQYGKISDRLKLAEVGTRESEKVAEHALAVAFHGQFREGIKDVVSAPAGPLDYLVNSTDECFESGFGTKVMDLCTRIFTNEFGVFGKTKIDEFCPPELRVCYEQLHEGDVIIYGIHLPYNVISWPDAVEYSIQCW